MPTFHIPRNLIIGDFRIAESDRLAGPGVAIVLAEPGAGKSALLASLAARFGTTPVKASIFERTTAPCIVVDAFDEVARIDPHAWLANTLTSIVNGHKQSQIDELLPWNYPAKV